MGQNLYKILIIEDDNKLRNTLCEYFEQYDFEVLSAADGAEGLRLFFDSSAGLQLVILDGMLPKIDGFDILSEIRKCADVPVIMVTARESEEDQLEGYSRGADGYITKPFLMSALRMQALALIGRYSGVSQKGIKKGELFIDTSAHKVFLGGKELSITPKEYELLLCFSGNEGILLSRDQILNSVWGFQYDGDIRTVDTHVKQLRKKMTDEYPYIVSIYGMGYRFEVPKDA